MMSPSIHSQYFRAQRKGSSRSPPYGFCGEVYLYDALCFEVDLKTGQKLVSY